jgi:predicted RNA binding protein YcfA (HicA-like mRNA interferase family)
MTKQDKLIKKLLSKPKDFTFDEMEKLLIQLGFEKKKSGKTGGSRVRFYNPDEDCIIILHKPHPQNEIKSYVLNQVILNLKNHNLI